MLTKFTLPDGCDFDKDMVGICVDTQSCIGSGDTLKLYVPALMAGIRKADPKVETVLIGYNTGILNAPEVRPTFKTHIKTCNYIEATMDNNSTRNSNWYSVAKPYSGYYYRDKVIPGSKFEVSFVHGSLLRPVFSTNYNL